MCYFVMPNLSTVSQQEVTEELNRTMIVMDFLSVKVDTLKEDYVSKRMKYFSLLNAYLI